MRFIWANPAGLSSGTFGFQLQDISTKPKVPSDKPMGLFCKSRWLDQRYFRFLATDFSTKPKEPSDKPMEGNTRGHTTLEETQVKHKGTHHFEREHKGRTQGDTRGEHKGTHHFERMNKPFGKPTTTPHPQEMVCPLLSPLLSPSPEA